MIRPQRKSFVQFPFFLCKGRPSSVVLLPDKVEPYHWPGTARAVSLLIYPGLSQSQHWICAASFRWAGSSPPAMSPNPRPFLFLTAWHREREIWDSTSYAICTIGIAERIVPSSYHQHLVLKSTISSNFSTYLAGNPELRWGPGRVLANCIEQRKNM